MIPVGTWRRRSTVSMEGQIETRRPLFAHLFGLHPWHILRLTYAEWETYRDWAEDYVRERQTRG